MSNNTKRSGNIAGSSYEWLRLNTVQLIQKLSSKITKNKRLPDPPVFGSRPFFIPPPKLPMVDLLLGILGNKLMPECGWKTALPTIAENGINLLNADIQRVRRMANLDNSTPPECSMVKYLNAAQYGSHSAAILEDIRALTGKGYFVVVPATVCHEQRKFESIGQLEVEYGLAAPWYLVLEMHGLVYHQFLLSMYLESPQVYTTVPDFIDRIDDPSFIAVIFDLPLAKEAIPPPFHILNDSTISWRH
ncbi:hypothetical protein BT96DRAFT_947552 [Gymnopus androsaceus JB14]|uniref:Uncharacterized protein n=1 Tax=Gymnopus androsaceus JB14 TaxID=1447944 RepID=A0A6A4GRU5_9AGAR|nr:hypothetical protein BT96DRAFT_947552 [Gymnopus androsaceus JB14]